MAHSLKPLTGCRILDLSTLLPGPYCSWLLASFGAEVIKIEPAAGDPLRTMNPAMFTMLHRGKKSVVLDLKQVDDRKTLLKMAASADILLEGFRPGTLDRLGLPVSTLHAVSPQLVVGSLSGFGGTGPYREHPAHDMGVLALSGYFAVPSQLDHQVVRPQLRMADMIAGQTAAMALTMAWIQARATGEGSHVDTSIYDATMGWTVPMLLSANSVISSDRAEQPAPADYPHVMADSAMYPTADGRHLSIATLEDKYWLSFVEAVRDLAPALDDPRWHTRRGRDQHKLALAQALTQAIASQPLAVWTRRLRTVATSVEPVLLGDEALNHPQAQARSLFAAHSADGQPEVHFPAWFDGQPPASLGAAPTLGQHQAHDFLTRAARPHADAALSSPTQP